MKELRRTGMIVAIMFLAGVLCTDVLPAIQASGTGEEYLNEAEVDQEPSAENESETAEPVNPVMPESGQGEEVISPEEEKLEIAKEEKPQEDTKIEESEETAKSLEIVQDQRESVDQQQIESKENIKNQGTEELEDSNTLEAREDNAISAATAYDVNQPVIESFEFLENGQTLTAEDILHFRMQAYDADSGIKEVVVTIESNDFDIRDVQTVSLKWSGEGNLYTGDFSCNQLTKGDFHIGTISVKDEVGNATLLDTQDNVWWLYTFKIITESEEDIKGDIFVSNFQITTQDIDRDGRLGINDTVTCTVDVICKDETITSCRAYSKLDRATDRNSLIIDMQYEEDIKKLVGTYTITDRTYPGKWNIYSINVHTQSGKDYSFSPDDVEKTELTFVIENDQYDTEKPVIESVSLDKNGQFVEAGEVLTLTVKASDANLSPYAEAFFEADALHYFKTNIVDLTLDPEKEVYTGTFTIEESTYPCEWYLKELSICDEWGNYASIPELESKQYPWYYQVKNEDTYVGVIRDIKLEFYGVKIDTNTGKYELSIISEKVEKVGRRASLKELGIKLPQLEKLEELQFIGWEYCGQLIDEDTILYFGNSIEPFRARYDKCIVSAEIFYMTEKGNKSNAQIQKLVNPGTTYGEILDILELPKGARTEGFTGFQFKSYIQQNNDVGNYTYLHIDACYTTYPVNIQIYFSGQDGVLETTTWSHTYPVGTKLDDIRDDLEEPMVIEDAEFEQWFLHTSYKEVCMDTIQGLKAYALYQGKTTVVANFFSCGETGGDVANTKILLIDGENLSESQINAEVGKYGSHINHYKELELEEWETGGYNSFSSRVKQINLGARYKNCLIRLYYPNGTEYIVVDKNTRFTLPVGNDLYKNIIWVGYQPGAIIMATGNRSFYPSRYDIKDDTEEPKNPGEPTEPENPEEPIAPGKPEQPGEKEPEGGIGLTEERIAGITDEIERTSEGGTVFVNMQDVTVVPKQILESVRGKDVDIVLNMNGYSWVINGVDVMATELKDINLEVTIDTNAVPTRLIKELAGEKPTKQLSLTHNGNFGFRAQLILNLGVENSGEYGNLYYYDSIGKLVFMNTGRIDADGTVSLVFSHASDYLVVIDRNRNQEEGKEENSEPISVSENDRMKSPKTGE